MEISQHSGLYLWRWTLMKNKTRRPLLIIHSAPKQSQRGHLETKVEADSPFTASQHPTPRLLLILVSTCVSMIRKFTTIFKHV